MEDPEAAETKEFVEKQIALTNSILEKCETRHKLNERITALYDYPKYDCPFIRRGKYFYFYNKGLEPQSVLYVQESLESEAQVLLDPNTLSDDGTVSLPITAVSNDAKHLACGISKSGSDWMTIKLLRVEDRTFAADDLSWVKFSSIRWTHDHRGFFYSRYPAPAQNVGDAGTETNINLHHQVFYHYVGTDQAEDILCWSDPEHPRWLFGADITDDGKYLILTIDEGCDPVNRLYYCDLTTSKGGWKRSGGPGNCSLFRSSWTTSTLSTSSSRMTRPSSLSSQTRTPLHSMLLQGGMVPLCAAAVIARKGTNSFSRTNVIDCRHLMMQQCTNRREPFAALIASGKCSRCLNTGTVKVPFVVRQRVSALKRTQASRTIDASCHVQVAGSKQRKPLSQDL